jgi:hypothetical protein
VNPLGKVLSPIVFKSLLFLRENLPFWDVRIVSLAVKAELDELQERLNRDYYFR